MEEFAGQVHPQLGQKWQQVGQNIILVYQQCNVLSQVLKEMKREGDGDDKVMSFPKLNLHQSKNGEG